jgi:signal peptidase I
MPDRRARHRRSGGERRGAVRPTGVVRRQPGRHRRADDARAERPETESRGWLVVEGIRVVLVMTTMTVLSLGAWVVVPMAWGWDAYTVTSGSMTPLVRPGDVVVAAGDHEDVKVGTVVVIAPSRKDTQPITHRIVERLPDGRYRTKGDANTVPDSRLIRPDQIAGTARIVVPLAGLVQLYLGRAAPAAGLLLILFSVLIPVLRKTRRQTAQPALAAAVVCVLVVSAGTAGTSWGTSRAAWTGSTGAGQTWQTTAFYYQTVLASAPISYWRMNSTTSITDVMNVSPLTVSGTSALAASGLRGDPDPSLRFSRTANTYATSTNAAYRMTAPMTVAAWTNTNGIAFGRLVFKGTSAAGDVNYLLSFSSDGSFMRFVMDQTGSRATAGAAGKSDWVKDGTWKFVAGVYDGTMARLYVNGVEKDAVAATSMAGSNNRLAVSESGSNAMDADIDEVTLWNRALSAAEIQNLWNVGKK